MTDTQTCHVYERPVHQAFVRPFNAADVQGILQRMPQHFLTGLDAVHLMGGTAKLDKVAGGRRFYFGDYC